MGNFIPKSKSEIGYLKHNEQFILVMLFNSLVAPPAYPTWVYKFFSKSYHTMDLMIQLALLKYGEVKDLHDYTNKLLNLKFTEDTVIAVLRLQIEHLRDKCANFGLIIPDTPIINSLLSEIPDAYQWIR